MSQQFQGPYGPQQQFYGPPPVQPPAPKRKVPGWLKATGVAFGALILGVVIGTSGGGSTTTASTPAPTPTVTKSVPGPTTTKTVTNTVSEVPQACLDAIDNAETGFTYAAEALRAAGDFDTAGIEAATAKLKTVAPDWQANKELCRAAAK
jgi:hypothetical protein